MASRESLRLPTAAVAAAADVDLDRRDSSVNQWKKIRSLDGRSSLYTASVLCNVAIALVILFRERRFFAGRGNTLVLEETWDVGAVWNRLLQSLFLLVFAIVDGIVAFFLLVPNLCRFHRADQKIKFRWEFASFLFIIFADMLAASLVFSARRSFEFRTKRSQFESAVAHYFIISIFGGVIFVMNCLFLWIVLYGEAVDEQNRSYWRLVKTQLPQIIAAGRGEDTARSSEGRRVYIKGVNVLDYLTEKATHGLYYIAKVGRQKRDSPIRFHAKIKTAIKTTDAGVSTFVLWWAKVIRKIFGVKKVRMPKTNSFKAQVPSRWYSFSTRVYSATITSSVWLCLAKPIVAIINGIAYVFVNFRPGLQGFVQQAWDGVKEDEYYRHPAWVKGAVFTAGALTIYFGLVINTIVIGAINDIYHPLKLCVLAYPLVAKFFLRLINFAEPTGAANSGILGLNFVPEENTTSPSETTDTGIIDTLTGRLLPGFSDLGGALANGASVPQMVLQLLQRVNDNLEEDRYYNCTTRNRSAAPHFLLAAINLIEQDLENEEHKAGVDNPDDVFFEKTPGEITIVYDSLMKNLRWSIWVGYGCGLLVSLYSLFSVLRQYKRISLAIRSGLFTDLKLDEKMVIFNGAQANLRKVGNLVHQDPNHRKWERVIKKYPISDASFFFGILVSTAVLQLVVFGAIVAVILAFLASLPELLEVLRPIFPFVVALFVMWFLNEIVANKFIGQGILVKKYTIVHELYFLLFLIIYTGVYTVLGILYAVWRLIMLSMTTMLGINRLDKNLFTIFKRLDQGHNAFWATILMHHSFLDRGLEGHKMTRRKWLQLIKRAQAQPGVDISDPSLGLSSPRDSEYDGDVVLPPPRNTNPMGVSLGGPMVTKSIQSWYSIIDHARGLPERAMSESMEPQHSEILLPVRGQSAFELRNNGPLPTSLSEGPSQRVPRQLETVLEDDGPDSHRLTDSARG